MAPPAFSAAQLPRHALPKTVAQMRAAAAAAGAGESGHIGHYSVKTSTAVAAKKTAKANVEMEAMRLRVVEQYKELKLKQHAEKANGSGNGRR